MEDAASFQTETIGPEKDPGEGISPPKSNNPVQKVERARPRLVPLPKRNRKKNRTARSTNSGPIAFPRHALQKCMRIPQAILDQNAGNECTDRDAAAFAKLSLNGEVRVEISSALKFGLLERPKSGTVRPTELFRRIARPQNSNDRIEALREAVLKAPVISDAYKRYRGENLPDPEFLRNTAIDSFKVPRDRVETFVVVLKESLTEAQLLEDGSDKTRVIDITHTGGMRESVADEQLKKLGREAAVQSGDGCFVVMPFADPLGNYYSLLYEPAIRKAGLKAIRADADIFGTGKIVDQIWAGIRGARVLVAELTGRNPNVLYELGLAHALHKPVVLISSNEQDVPFDVRHVRVIYYDVHDPFWGDKLIDKVAENILSALRNPNEAILFPEGV